jgi:hypothetical protein
MALSLVADTVLRYPFYLLLAALVATVRPLALQPASSHTILILMLSELTLVLMRTTAFVVHPFPR